jgi:alpha-beta hydrolase superfamily lysophospholipase
VPTRLLPDRVVPAADGRDRDHAQLWTARVHVDSGTFADLERARRNSRPSPGTLTAVETPEVDLLGAPYERITIKCDDDDEGAVVATLVRRRQESQESQKHAERAVLYIHGFTDYYFQAHLADFYVNQGIDFYAIDLRKHGRSLLPHQTANFTRNLAEYFAELDAAMRIVRDEDRHTRVLVNAHSTGALTAALWAHDRRADGLIDAMFLNSPFFEFNVPAATRRTLGPAMTALARSRPYALVPASLNQVYGRSIHADHDGEWRYDLAWKPLGGFPVRAGWVAAIRGGQARLRRGLDIPVPILVGTSGATYRSAQWSEAAHHADAVLNPVHMALWAPGLGRHVTLVRFDGGRHDLTLSRPPVRERVFAELATWLDAYFPA